MNKEDKIIDINYDDGCFLLSAVFFENYDMVDILIKYFANIHIQNNKPYELALQNNNEKYLKLLL